MDKWLSGDFFFNINLVHSLNVLFSVHDVINSIISNDIGKHSSSPKLIWQIIYHYMVPDYINTTTF